MLWIRILLSCSKNSKKNLDSYYFVTLFDFFFLRNDDDINIPFARTSVPDPNLDPPDPHVFWPPRSASTSQRYPDPALDPAPARILLSPSKNSKKNIDSYCFVTSLWLYSLKNDVNVPSKSNKQKNFRLTSWRSLTKITGSGTNSQRYGSADPDPYQNFMDAQHCLQV